MYRVSDKLKLCCEHVENKAINIETEMEIDSDQEHVYEREGLFEVESELESEDEGARSDVCDSCDTVTETYNFDVSVAIAETVDEDDQMDAEFGEALEEIEGKKSFPCAICDKVCKSKGGLTRHTNSKHSDAALVSESTQVPLCEGTVVSIIESIKTNLIEENLYSSDINNSLRNISAGEALFNALKPLYDTFCRKKNQDKLTESFYGLIPQSCKYLNCKDYRVANLVMIQIPDHLVGFYRMNQTEEQTSQTTSTTTKLELDPAERGPLSYVAGYVVSKLHKTSWRKKNTRNEELLSLLQSLRSPQDSNAFISARTRGGLITPCDDLVGILETAEMLFRKEFLNVQSEEGTLTRNIPTENICNSTVNSPKVKSLWENILLSAGVDKSSSTHKLCLENIIKLYLKVRSFSYARDYITKYKIKAKQLKNKALRKDMKKSSKV